MKTNLVLEFMKIRGKFYDLFMVKDSIQRMSNMSR